MPATMWCAQGDTDGSLFIVARGVFEVSLDNNGKRVAVARLGRATSSARCPF
jgi:CRP-like cAMP-binding protein